jgi:hypothetical protein
MVIAYVDRVNLTIALPEMSRGLNLDRTSSDMALSAFF